MGEKLEDLEVFHPDRMASRILGMGDVLSLVGKSPGNHGPEKGRRPAEEDSQGQSFTLEDFRDQLAQVKKLGSLEQIMEMIPGMGKFKHLRNMQEEEGELIRTEAIINSMTKQERQEHNIINASRRRRIAMGSGTTVQDVNKLLKNFNQTRKMLRKVTKGGMKGLLRGGLPF